MDSKFNGTGIIMYLPLARQFHVWFCRAACTAYRNRDARLIATLIAPETFYTYTRALFTRACVYTRAETQDVSYICKRASLYSSAHYSGSSRTTQTASSKWVYFCSMSIEARCIRWRCRIMKYSSPNATKFCKLHLWCNWTLEWSKYYYVTRVEQFGSFEF